MTVVVQRRNRVLRCRITFLGDVCSKSGECKRRRALWRVSHGNAGKEINEVGVTLTEITNSGTRTPDEEC